MNRPVMHQKTAEQLNIYLQRPPQALLLVGTPGSGKATLATTFLAEIFAIGTEKVHNHPYIHHIRNSDGKAIGIEAVRGIENFLSLKVPGAGDYRRAVLIEDGELLTHEAQNALLKTLEEPPADSILLITAAHPQALLPTVRSRTQVLRVHPPDFTQLSEYFAKAGRSEQDIQQAYAMSSGLPGLMSDLLDDREHPLQQAVKQAKRLLQASAFDRLIIIDELSKQRHLAEQVLLMIQQMARLSLLAATGPAAKRWQAILAATYQSTESLHLQAQPKLVLTNFCLQF